MGDEIDGQEVWLLLFFGLFGSKKRQHSRYITSNVGTESLDRNNRTFSVVGPMHCLFKSEQAKSFHKKILEQRTDGIVRAASAILMKRIVEDVLFSSLWDVLAAAAAGSHQGKLVVSL